MCVHVSVCVHVCARVCDALGAPCTAAHFILTSMLTDSVELSYLAMALRCFQQSDRSWVILDKDCMCIAKSL